MIATLTISALVIAAIAFIVLFVILAVPLWISFIVAGGIIVVSAILGGAGTMTAQNHRGAARAGGH
jgi:hypothetical protein